MAKRGTAKPKSSSDEPKKLGAEEPASPREPEKPAAAFPVVGIGASAGGLAAFEAFFSGMPADADPGMAFVLVQHLAPDHESILTELVKRYTRMEVFEVEDGMVVKPNCAYIIPPNKDMAFLNGTLQLLEPTAPRGQRLPIDFFFRSLADDQRERAICIVLSGTGSDGTMGMRAIKGEGGMAMAQNPESTEFDGMPNSAINTGLVDYILPPAEMPAQLIAYTAHAFLNRPANVPQFTPHGEDELQKVFVLLRARTGNDFSQYKRSTLQRRIERRMAVNQIDRIEDYVRHLQRDPGETDALFRDLLIGVTSFFRDPDVFDALQEKAISRILASSSASDSVRVWVPACSTGEEAYSIAIQFHEQMESLQTSLDITIFATDIDSRAVEQARAGTYLGSIAADVTPERLQRYFVKGPDENTFRPAKAIRDMLVFSEQNVAKDPPFSRLDLISCRNLLIYMSGTLQGRLIPMFHYALKPGGFLLVGTSESICGFTDLFATVDAKAKIYSRKEDGLSAQPVITGWAGRSERKAGAGVSAPKEPPDVDSPLRELTERELLKRPAPVAALVNQRGEILYLHGRTGRYLEPSPGKAGLNILKMAREGLGRDLANALRKAATQEEPVTRPGLRVKTNGDFTVTDLTVSRVDSGGPVGGDSAMYLVLLEEARQLTEAASPQSARSHTGNGGEVDAQVAELQQELRVKEEYLQTTLEEAETANEELQSTNEEMQSVNEELQSTNEELETSKEELQSVNEELATVNSELQQRVSDLSRANNDMSNLLAGTGIGTIFVDNALRIQRFTPAAAQVINLILSDVGRPVGHIMPNLFGYDRLVADVEGVLATLVPTETEVQTKDGEWYLLRIRPYRTVENVIDGAAITFTDITELKKAQQAVLELQGARRLATIVNDANDAILVCDLDGRILAWNPRATRVYGWTEAEALELNIRDLTPEDQREKALAVTVQLAHSETIEPYQVQRITKDGRLVTVTLTATVLLDDEGKPYAVSTTERERVSDA